MLVLTRREGESVMIGDDVQVLIEKTEKNKVSLRIESHKELPICINELLYPIERTGFSLIVSRREGQSVFIGGNIEIQIVVTNNNSIRIGVKAPMEISVKRQEIYKALLSSQFVSA